MHFYTNVIQHKNQLLVCGYKNGQRYRERVHYRPYLFCPSNEPTTYKNLEGKYVARQDFNSIYEAKKFYYDYKEVEGFTIYGSTQFQYNYLRENFRDCKYETAKIQTVYMDIEVSMEDGGPNFETADKPITAITLMYPGNITFALGYKDFTPTNDQIKYIKCKTEAELLTKFIKIWSSDVFMPDVVTGWNINGFDIPYVINRIIQVLGDNEARKLSPWGILIPRQFDMRGRSVTAFTIAGVAALDYLELYRKFILKPRESYSLNFIASEEIGEKKLDYSEYENLNELYQKNHQLFMEYNVRDCDLVFRLEKKLRLLELVYIFAYDSLVNYTDTLTSVRLWDIIIGNYLLDRHLVLPPHKEAVGEFGKVLGAYVKSPQVGMHQWVVSFDLTSLYPSLIMAYNISPDVFRGMMPLTEDNEGKIEKWLEGMPQHVSDYLEEHNLALACNGAMFSKEKQGFLSVLMEDLFEKRKVFKNKMLQVKDEFEKTKDKALEAEIARYDNLQKTAKVKLNSAYGAFANEGFRFYDRRMAEAITMSGQLTIRWAENHINRFLNGCAKTNNIDYVLAADTDSLYINMGAVVSSFGLTDTQEIVDRLDQFCANEMQDELNRIFKNLVEQQHCMKQTLHMKRETISERGIFTAKKRYILNMWDEEGIRFDKVQLKIMGLEAIRSSTPTACRAAIKETIKIIMNGTEEQTQKYIKEFRDRYETLPFEDIARTSGINGLRKYSDSVTLYRSGCPIHVRGAIIYNKILEEKGLKGKFNPIYEKDKIKFCYLKVPNPTGEDVIAAPGMLPKDLDLDRFLDRQRQYETTYLEPMKTLLQNIGWEHEKRTKLSSFFE